MISRDDKIRDCGNDSISWEQQIQYDIELGFFQNYLLRLKFS